MARVYLAHHTGLDRLVAIKVLSKNLDGDKSFSDRFLREARIVASLTQQNIITVYNVGVYNEFHYIAMEYLSGETLDDKIKNKLDIKQISGITKQITLALNFAHKKGFVHHDVRPDNILFREGGTAVLTDFGIDRSAKSETKMTTTGEHPACQRTGIAAVSILVTIAAITFFPAQQGSSKVKDTAADNALASERYASARQNYEKSQPMMPTTNDLLKAADNALQTVGREINQLQNKYLQSAKHGSWRSLSKIKNIT